MECKICGQLIDEGETSSFVKLGEKGANGVNNASKEQNDNINVNEGDVVHVNCRKNYLKKRKRSSTASDDGASCATRSKNTFDFHSKCFLCGIEVTERERQTEGVSRVSCKEREVDISIEEQILKRGNDEWAIAVNGRMQFISDLRAEDAIYHPVCMTNFRLGRAIPTKYSGNVPKESAKLGRPQEAEREKAYTDAKQFLLEKVCNDELVTLYDMQTVMNDALTGTELTPFTTKWIQSRLMTDFPDEIFIATVNRRVNVITFRSTANKILSDFHKTSKNIDSEEEKINIVKAAAKLIKCEIKEKDCDLTTYPSFSPDNLSTEYVTTLLNVFLEELITSSGNDIRRAAIGQSIMQSARPNSLICPLTIGLAVQLHSMFGSRIMIDVLFKMGFCTSYTEVLKFMVCAAFYQNITLPIIPETSVLHYAADNVDHNVRTLDGHNTFHGMGIIAIITPGCFAPQVIPRRNVTNDEILSVGSIEFKTLQLNRRKDLSFRFERLKEYNIIDNTKLLGTLWQSAWILKPHQPQWSGTMQSVLDGSHPGKSTVHIMPMIDEKSSDYSCIYTTMVFIAKEAKRYGKHPILTFDQPLYWKAMEIKKHEKDSTVSEIVLILGSFHILMSFLGSIGHLMMGTGLQPLLEQVYAENTVPHILSGKAVSRARRAHMLAVCALEGLKVAQIYDIDLESNEENEDEFDLNTRFMQHPELRGLADILQKSLSKDIGVDQLTEQHIFRKLLINHEKFVESQTDSKTSKLWLMYMDMVDIMCTFLKAERTGNFLLHQQSVKSMLPYFAASGHYLYAKSAYVYLQQMQQLPFSQPEVYKSFLDGYNVVRRSDKFFAGIGTDLMIEQELMRSVKTTGGLTHGRGMTELQRTKWLLSTTTTSTIKHAMEEFTGVRYESSEQHVAQHKECSPTRSLRDYKDAMKMLQYLIFRNPFEGHQNIVCIETGEEGDNSVNVHNSKAIGLKVIDNMVGQSVLNYSFSKKDMAVTMKPRSSVVIDGEVVAVDPQLLFQRLLITVGRDEVQLKSALQHELCSHPASLFGKDLLMREADKPVLADEVWKIVDQHAQLPKDSTYVLDGGNLLFKMKWKKGTTFENIFKSYVQYVLKNYGKKSIIVFDGYPETPSTKDTTHIRRKASKLGRCVNITPHMKLNMSKTSFMSVLKNKDLFNRMLTEYINNGSSGLSAIQENGDADYLLAKTAVSESQQKDVVVISADTDVLILLLHHANSSSTKGLFLTSDSTSSSKSPPKCWNIPQIKRSLGDEVCESILQIHAILGCDTTSRIHGIGKGASLKRFQKDEHFREYLIRFSNSSASQEEIAEAGERVLLMLYGERSDANLNNIRYDAFCKKISTSSKAVLPENLPPTSDAARFHSFRVFHQVQRWKGVLLPVLDWGWIMKGNFLLPKRMSQAPAPTELLKLIKCNCKSGCAPNSNCSCQKNNFKCTPMCGSCKGVSCCNHQEIDDTDTDSNEN